MRLRLFIWLITVMGWLSGPVLAERVTVAVAANFLVPAQDIAAAFEAETGHDVTMVHGSTGKLYAQIVAGAPFDVFLSADVARPALLVEQGLAPVKHWKTYAFGRLALVHGASTKPGLLDEILSRDRLRIAIADPDIAPYGMAARAVLQKFRGGNWDQNLILGESVGQAFAFVATGNVDLALVALAQARSFDGDLFTLEIPQTLHDPIQQDAVILNRASDNPAAIAFLNYLGGGFAIQSLQLAGYEVPQ